MWVRWTNRQCQCVPLSSGNQDISASIMANDVIFLSFHNNRWTCDSCRYNPQWFGEVLEEKQIQEVEKMNCELMKKLQEQETNISFSSGTVICLNLLFMGICLF